MGLFNKLKKEEVQSNEIKAVCDGKIIPIEDVNDVVFQTKALGDGVGIITDQTSIYAPVSGVVTVAFPTKHAFGIKTKNNIEVLIHIGVDTVELNGKGFKSLIKQGQKIKAGDLLVDVDFEFLKQQNYDSTIMMVVTNTNDYKNISKFTGYKKQGESVMEVYE